MDSYVTVVGADGPGQLALLILDAEALGADPNNFGGTDLVEPTAGHEQTSGPDAGLFGTETQVADYSPAPTTQGLALAALAAAGVRGTSQLSAAISWLVAEQCPDGGWTTPDNAINACTGDRPTSSGPDTNSTSLALEGLAAQGAATAGGGVQRPGFLGSAGRTLTPAGRTSRTPGHAGHQRSRLDRVGHPGVDRHRRLTDRRAVHQGFGRLRCRPCCPSS